MAEFEINNEFVKILSDSDVFVDQEVRNRMQELFYQLGGFVLKAKLEKDPDDCSITSECFEHPFPPIQLKLQRVWNELKNVLDSDDDKQITPDEFVSFFIRAALKANVLSYDVNINEAASTTDMVDKLRVALNSNLNHVLDQFNEAVLQLLS